VQDEKIQQHHQHQDKQSNAQPGSRKIIIHHKAYNKKIKQGMQQQYQRTKQEFVHQAAVVF